MAENEQAIEWYLARDGQRHGPISDLEMRTLVGLGHLKPTDLVWRHGFANWEVASTVFPASPPRPAPPPPAQQQAQAPQPQPQPQAQPAPQPQPAPAPAPARPATSLQQPAPQRPSPSAAAAPRPQMPTAKPAAGPTPADSPMGVRAAEAQAHTTITPNSNPGSDPNADPLRHRRMPTPDAQTRRTSGYGEVPLAQQAGAPHPGHPGAPAPGVGRQPAPQPGLQLGPRAGPQTATSGGPQPQHQPAPGPSMPTQMARPLAVPLEEPHDLDEDPIVPPRRRGRLWSVVAFVALLSIGSGILYGLFKTGRLNLSALPITTAAPASKSPAAPAPPGRVSKESFKESPLKGYAPSAAEVDANFQKSGLWQIVKRDFPAAYNEAIADASKLKSEGNDDRAISVHLMRKLVDLRRKNASDALAAKPERLQAVAQAFIDNLGALSRVSVEACYRFISGGETDPMMIEMMRSPEQTGSMQTQLATVFEAVVDGRTTKAKIATAERKDYDLLAAQLSVRGWSPADLALFDDARALSRATPQKVCQMVQDWFAAQLSIKDPAVQTRLFGATLRPLIGE